MTFRFNHFNYSERDEGRVLVCTHAETKFFTEGKRYPIHVNPDNKQPYILDDEGEDITESSSEFDFPLALMQPKQPKVGEVWSLTGTGADFQERSLYVVVRVADGRVTNRHILGGGIHNEYLPTFLEQHTFVF